MIEPIILSKHGCKPSSCRTSNSVMRSDSGFDSESEISTLNWDTGEFDTPH